MTTQKTQPWAYDPAYDIVEYLDENGDSIGYSEIIKRDDRDELFNPMPADNAADDLATSPCFGSIVLATMQGVACQQRRHKPR